MMSQVSDPTAPSQASTIILVRPDGGKFFEVLLTRRPQDMQVLGGYVVFPGGRVEQTDGSERMLSRCLGLAPDDARQKLSGAMPPAACLAYWVAAIRELFEESGIHFFVTADGTDPTVRQAELPTERLAKLRQAVAAGRITLAELLESEALYCDLSRLIYLFHRITPEKHKVRFDTRFFLAALPAGQIPLDFSEEVAESLWLMPKTALRMAESGTLPMMPPTLLALRALAEIETWSQLCSHYPLNK
jgi:8-oxo-dGTP pyrophosphatase MutT (NUDIX family)